MRIVIWNLITKIISHIVLFVEIKIQYVGPIQENEIEGPIYTLKYSTGERMQKKIEEKEAIREAEESWYLWEE